MNTPNPRSTVNHGIDSSDQSELASLDSYQSNSGIAGWRDYLPLESEAAVGEGYIFGEEEKDEFEPTHAHRVNSSDGSNEHEQIDEEDLVFEGFLHVVEDTLVETFRYRAHEMHDEEHWELQGDGYKGIRHLLNLKVVTAPVIRCVSHTLGEEPLIMMDYCTYDGAYCWAYAAPTLIARRIKSDAWGSILEEGKPLCYRVNAENRALIASWFQTWSRWVYYQRPEQLSATFGLFWKRMVSLRFIQYYPWLATWKKLFDDMPRQIQGLDFLPLQLEVNDPGDAMFSTAMIEVNGGHGKICCNVVIE